MDYLLCADDGTAYTYTPDKNIISESDGKYFFKDPDRKWPLVTSSNKKKDPKALKILLGLQCNFRCEYCSQTENIPATPIEPDIEGVIAMLDGKDWNPRKVEFWGGEPFLYWKELSILIPRLRAKYPKAGMSIITNGSLITQEKMAFLGENKVHVVISHDGPGQFQRTLDPLYNKEIMEIIKRMVSTRQYKENSLFNAVLTPRNYDPVAVVEHLHRRVHPDAVISFEGVASIHKRTEDEKDLHFNNETGMAMAGAIAKGIIEGKLEKTSFMGHLRFFIQSLSDHRPATSIASKCGMNTASNIAFDLQGNILFCHNTTEAIGHLNDPECRVDNSKMTPWMERPNCKDCLIQQLCRGGCMSIESEEAWKASCNNSYYYHLGIFMGAFSILTGKILKSTHRI